MTGGPVRAVDAAPSPVASDPHDPTASAIATEAIQGKDPVDRMTTNVPVVPAGQKFAGSSSDTAPNHTNKATATGAKPRA